MKKEGTTTPRHKVTHNPIPTSLFCFNMLFVCLFVCYECINAKQTAQHLDIQLPAKCVMLWSWKKQRCRDGVMSDFVSWCSCSFLFHEVTSLHPPSFHRNDFSTCSTHFFFWGKATKMRRASTYIHVTHADNALQALTRARVHAHVMASFSVCP